MKGLEEENAKDEVADKMVKKEVGNKSQSRKLEMILLRHEKRILAPKTR